MNTTHKVSIGGIAFTVEESAFEVLKSYIDKLERQFKGRPDGQEIISDIESRIAELINMKLTNVDQLVMLSDVKDVLEKLGDPSEMDEGEEKNAEESHTYSYTSTRRLYRSAESKVIGGVCGGLGTYLNVDPVWLRIAFVALSVVGTPFAFGWFFIIAYIVLWISVPQAVTVSQKLEMEGKHVTVSTIEQRIREEAKNFAPHIKSAGERASGVLSAIVKVFAIFILSIFVIVGLALSFALIVALFGVTPAFLSSFGGFATDSDFALFNIAYSILPNIAWFKTSLLALVGIPTILLILVVIKLLFRSNFRTRYLVIPLTVAWFIALFGVLTTGVATLSRSFGSNSTVTETVSSAVPVDTLKIGYDGSVALKPNDMLLTLRNNDADWDDVNVTVNGNSVVNIRNHSNWKHKKGFSVFSKGNSSDVKLKESSVIYVRPLVNVEYSDNIDKPKVLVKKWATGKNYNMATETAEDIKFSALFRGDSLLITPATPVRISEKILKGVEITVLIPKGKVFTVSREMLTSLKNYNSKRVNGVYTYDSENYTDNEFNDVVDVDTVVVN